MSEAFSLNDWSRVDPEPFDAKAQYEAHVAPLLNQAADACARLGIPMIVVACTAQSERGSASFTSSIIPAGIGRVPAEILAADLLLRGDHFHESTAKINGLAILEAKKLQRAREKHEQGVLQA